MSWFIDSSQEEAYRLLMDYFDGRRMRVKTSDLPSYIEAGFGSWTEMVLDNAKGEVKARIAKKNGGSDISLNLDFALEYYPALLLTIAGVAATYILYDFMRVPSTWALFVMLVEVLMVWGIVAYSISVTKRKILEEFNTFMQSLSAKRQRYMQRSANA